MNTQDPSQRGLIQRELWGKKHRRQVLKRLEWDFPPPPVVSWASPRVTVRSARCRTPTVRGPAHEPGRGLRVMAPREKEPGGSACPGSVT